ncbi:hypothetical protein [Nitratifractor sp.]
MLDDINKRVFLLGILTREPGESIREVTLSLANTGMFTLKEGKKIRKELEAEGYIVEGELSVKGMIEAKKAEEEFRL